MAEVQLCMCTWVWASLCMSRVSPKMTWATGHQEVGLNTWVTYYCYDHSLISRVLMWIPFWTFSPPSKKINSSSFSKNLLSKLVFHKAHVQYSWYILPYLRRYDLGGLLWGPRWHVVENMIWQIGVKPFIAVMEASEF